MSRRSWTATERTDQRKWGMGDTSSTYIARVYLDSGCELMGGTSRVGSNCQMTAAGAAGAHGLRLSGGQGCGHLSPGWGSCDR